METEFIKNWVGKLVSVVIDYKNPSGFDDNIKGILTEVGDDFIVIIPEVKFCKSNLIRWQYIKSIRLYEEEATSH
jgi:hypothetical protein